MGDVLVPVTPGDWDESSGQIRAPASAGLFARPVVQTANHLLGWKLGTLKVVVTASAGVPVLGTGYHRSKIARHPNATHVLVIARVASYTSVLTGGTITVTAGTGAATARMVEGSVPSTCIIAAPYAAGDSGHVNLLLKIEDCTVQSVGVWELHRRTLDTASDDVIDTLDASYRLAGLAEGQFLVHSVATDGVWGMATAVKAARDGYLRQAVAWYDVNGTGWTSTGNAFANPFDTDFSFRGRARTYRASDTHRHYTAYLYCVSDAAGAETFEWQITTNVGGPYGSGAIAAVGAAGWYPAAGVTIELDNTAIDDIHLEVKTSAAAKSVTVYGLSIVQEDHA